MRSTAFTSTAFAGLALALALPAVAVAEGPTAGCYARDYGAEHLARHPEQVVARMRLLVGGEGGPGETLARLEVVLADQGRTRAEGVGDLTLRQALACTESGGGLACGVECDGGRFAVSEDAEGLTLSTDRLLVGGDGGGEEGCGGAFDIAERPGEPVTYRLGRAAPDACEGL